MGQFGTNGRSILPIGITDDSGSFVILQPGIPSSSFNVPASMSIAILKSASFAIEADPDDKSSVQFRIPSRSAGTINDRIAFYISGSGEIGIGTKDPETSFDVRDAKEDVDPKRRDLKSQIFKVTKASQKFDTPVTASIISASGNIIGDNITGESLNIGSAFSVSSGGNITTLNSLIAGNSSIFDTHTIKGKTTINGNITASGNISSSGNLITNNITASNLHASETISSTQIEANRFVSFLGSSYTEGQSNFISIDSRSSTPFISLKGPSGFGATQIKPETTSFGDKVTAGIIQKGSGSFEILLDADSTRGQEPHFGIRSNTAIPGTIGTKLFTVSESFETRVHNGGLRADNYVVTTNITASGNISGSNTTTASFGSLQLSNLPTSPTGLPTGSVWVSGSKNDTSTNNVRCGTLMVVL